MTRPATLPTKMPPTLLMTKLPTPLAAYNEPKHVGYRTLDTRTSTSLVSDFLSQKLSYMKGKHNKLKLCIATQRYNVTDLCTAAALCNGAIFMNYANAGEPGGDCFYLSSKPADGGPDQPAAAASGRPAALAFWLTCCCGIWLVIAVAFWLACCLCTLAVLLLWH